MSRGIPATVDASDAPRRVLGASADAASYLVSGASGTHNRSACECRADIGVPAVLVDLCL